MVSFVTQRGARHSAGLLHGTGAPAGAGQRKAKVNGTQPGTAAAAAATIKPKGQLSEEQARARDFAPKSSTTASAFTPGNATTAAPTESNG